MEYKAGWSPSSTYWSIQLPLLIHPEVESTVHASNADQAHRYTDKFQNAYKQRVEDREQVRAQSMSLESQHPWGFGEDTEPTSPLGQPHAS